MLDVRRLRLLRELALRGTIASVAEALSFSPSAVSQQLAVLEREAGVPLLERTGRRVRLTPAGRNLAGHAEVVLQRLEQAAGELIDARQGLAGSLRIGTFPTAARAILPTALLTLGREHPGLEPMVSEIDPADVADALRAGDLDLALIHDYDFVPLPTEPGLTTLPLCSESVYLASTSGKEAISECKDLPWITSIVGTACHAMTVRACQANGFTPRERHHIDEFATVLAMVAAGQGVALIPQLGAVDPPADVVLTRLQIRRRTMIAYRAGADAHPAVSTVTAALRRAVPAELGTHA
ncbi:LysR family transcriptional regulator [Antrihabitans stalactiti]|uniref:LysR family transcriptional regulator n=1 Tax=Antrihabitans stalactiti TaxID=2584121 RepID=A0A848KBX6_9NOCA|nr:LysR family transcriptional regulator [Antrihabitans stalactiti]NMN93610.1 LysR family transcriptional regulator [Antrihabitans stalactiti]